MCKVIEIKISREFLSIQTYKIRDQVQLFVRLLQIPSNYLKNFSGVNILIALGWERFKYYHLRHTHKPEDKRTKTLKQVQLKDIYKMPITPHATRPPAFPVFFESGWSVLPRSSSSLCTTMARPIMLLAPKSVMTLSENDVETLPFSSAITFPKSPTWRTWASRAPWCKRSGL